MRCFDISHEFMPFALDLFQRIHGGEPAITRQNETRARQYINQAQSDRGGVFLAVRRISSIFPSWSSIAIMMLVSTQHGVLNIKKTGSGFPFMCVNAGGPSGRFSSLPCHPLVDSSIITCTPGKNRSATLSLKNVWIGRNSSKVLFTHPTGPVAKCWRMNLKRVLERPYLQSAMGKFTEFADLHIQALILRQKMDEVLIHKTY